MVIRNPFPIPDVSTEGFWISPGPSLGEKISANDRRWSSRLEPHERLFAHHTLNSIRRDHRLVRTKAPNDALDLALTSTYAHNEDTLVPKMYVHMQPEALGRDTWRVLRNELKSPDVTLSVVGKAATRPEVSEKRAEMRSKESRKNQERGYALPAATRAASAPVRSAHKTAGGLHRYAQRTRHVGLPDRVERIHPSSLKLSIEGPHTDQTNPGYSRKDNGSFFAV